MRAARCLIIVTILLSFSSLASPEAPAAAPPQAASEAVPEGIVLVPAGPFLMGTDTEEGSFNKGDSGPQRTVRLAAYYIDKNEVTNAEYKRYCDATGYPAPPHWSDGNYPAGMAALPVSFVNWWEAQAYALWKGKRLPTEAEWEKAARGIDGRTYPWGETWNPDLLVWQAESPQAVGSIPGGASPYGALDMAGNVFEWVADWYQAYPGSTLTFPQYGTQYKVVRGGGFDVRDYDLYTFHRSLTRPAHRSEFVGFRCAKSVGK
jgi:formylglycine-generating enzyme required for sulfatase activity